MAPIAGHALLLLQLSATLAQKLDGETLFVEIPSDGVEHAGLLRAEEKKHNSRLSTVEIHSDGAEDAGLQRQHVLLRREPATPAGLTLVPDPEAPPPPKPAPAKAAPLHKEAHKAAPAKASPLHKEAHKAAPAKAAPKGLPLVPHPAKAVASKAAAKIKKVDPKTVVAAHVLPAAPPAKKFSSEAPAELEPTSSSAYPDSVMASHPDAYWSMGDVVPGNRVGAQGRACGQPGALQFGDPCLVNGRIVGAPVLKSGLVPSNTVNKAMEFSGKDNEEVVIPDDQLINTNQLGYQERTVELWFETKEPGPKNRVIFCEGNQQHSGISLYVNQHGKGNISLNMFTWDQGNHDNEFGTKLVTPHPISCPISKDTAYYVVMQFNAHKRSFTGWIKAPNSGLHMHKCGHITIPVNARLTHTGHGGGNAVIGGIRTTSRATGTEHMTGESHNFKGVVDEVAIYNRILPMEELLRHYSAAHEQEYVEHDEHEDHGEHDEHDEHDEHHEHGGHGEHHGHDEHGEHHWHDEHGEHHWHGEHDEHP